MITVILAIMKQGSKLIFILFLLVGAITTFGQSGNSVNPDDEFNLFLFSLLMIFICAMTGAAILGAMVATLILLFLLALLALGVLSTSVAIGLYRRSFAAGFKSFIMILFITVCAAIGGIGLVFVGYFFNLPTSTVMNLMIGISSGAMGGLLMALATYHVLLWTIKIMAQKFQIG
jgi:hypothetical protein